jgi:hypothetical protein
MHVWSWSNFKVYDHTSAGHDVHDTTQHSARHSSNSHHGLGSTLTHTSKSQFTGRCAWKFAQLTSGHVAAKETPQLVSESLEATGQKSTFHRKYMVPFPKSILLSIAVTASQAWRFEISEPLRFPTRHPHGDDQPFQTVHCTVRRTIYNIDRRVPSIRRKFRWYAKVLYRILTLVRKTRGTNANY